MYRCANNLFFIYFLSAIRVSCVMKKEAVPQVGDP
jgi:hypothetical protein